MFYSEKHVYATMMPLDENNQEIQEKSPSYSGEVLPSFIINPDGLIQGEFKQTDNGKFDFGIGKLEAKLTYANTAEYNARFSIKKQEKSDNYILSVDAVSELQPGSYKLEVNLTKGKQTSTITQDFSWGVLAINFSQSSYKANQPVDIGMAVLNDRGETVCDASVLVTVTAPNQEVTILSSQEKSVQVSDTCADQNVTSKPDYLAYFQPQQEGEYSVEMTAETPSGKRTTKDLFRVINESEIVVTRLTTAMRIYPLAEYSVTLRLTSAREIAGGIKEVVPSSFEIKNISNNGVIVDENETTKIISWPAKMKAGSSLELSYTYDAPDVSPEFYTLGPLDIWQATVDGDFGGELQQTTIFTEPRAWQIAADAVTNNGVLIYGDITNAGTLKVRAFTNPSTFAVEFSGPASSASNIVHITGKTAPTREEIMIGHLKVDGRLDITSCTTGCDALADFTGGARDWNNPGTTATQDCDNAPTLGSCTRAFDIGYESLSGRGMVVYGDNVTDKAYYALWNGTAWSPNTTPGTPGVSNQIDLPGTAGTPKWIRVVPAGENLGDERSDRMMVLIADSNDDLFAFYWDGSSFDSGTSLYTSLNNCDRAQCFDGNWQRNNIFVVSYTNSDAGIPGGVNQIRYQKYTVGSSWSGDAQAYTLASAGTWVSSASDPTSSRIYVTTFSAGNDTRGAVWRADDATDIWTVCNSGGCPDTATEAMGGMQATAAFERYNGEALHVFNDAANGTTQGNRRMTYTPTSTWSTTAVTGITPTDDHQTTKIVAAPNSDDIMVMASDVDCDLDAILWTGGGFSTVGSNLETDLSSTNQTSTNCNNNTVPVLGMAIGYGYDFAWKVNSNFSRDWRWTSDTSTATPGSWLANQSTTPTGVADTTTVRLRFNFAERGNIAQTNSRKKLQYTTDSPDSLTASWTDVDAQAGSGIWRYANCAAGADDGAIPSTQLTGSTQVGDFIENGTAALTVTHNALAVQEYDYCLQANGTDGTTYYFRAYDLDQLSPVYREQDNDGSNDCASATCTYPSITMAAPQISIAGVVKMSNESTLGTTGNSGPCDGSTANISIRVNGGSATTGSCNSSTAAYSITISKPAAGSTITVYLTSTQKGNVVYITDTTADTGIDIYIDTVIIRHENAGPMTILDTLDYDNTANSTDMLFDAVDTTTDTFTVDDGAELHVWDGDTFTPGGTVTTSPSSSSSSKDGDVHIDGTSTLSMGTNSLSIGGDYANEGTFSKSTNQTTILTATATGHSLTDGGENFEKVTFNGSGGGWSFADSTTIDNDLTVTAGTLSGTSNITVIGNATCSGSCGTINMTGGTFEHRPATGKSFGTATGSNNWTFNNLTFSTSGTNGSAISATKIDDASNFLISSGGERNIVRTSSGVLYAVVADDVNDDIEVWSSSNGSNWTQQDAAGVPSQNLFNQISIAIDGNNDIHILYITNSNKTLSYIVFDTDTNTYNSSVNLHTSSTENISVFSIVIDSNSIPHVIYNTNNPSNSVNYQNRIGGSWGTAIQVASSFTPNVMTLTINEDDIVELGYRSTSGTTTVAVGNANNATSFTTHTFGTSFDSGTPLSMGVDSSGNTWIAYIHNVSGTRTVGLLKHNDSDGWTTWGSSIVSSISATASPGAATIAINGTDIYVFFIRSGSNGLWYVKYDTDFGTEVLLENGNRQSPTAKWSYNFNNGQSDQIDYLFYDGFDVYWHSLVMPTTTVAAGGSGSIIVSSDLTIGAVSDTDKTKLDLDVNDRIIDVDGNVNITTNGILSSSESANFTVGGNWVNNGMLEPNGGTITFNATDTNNTFTGTLTNAGGFGHMVFNGVGGQWSVDTSLEMAGDLTMTNGTIVGTNDMTVRGGDVTGTGTINLTGGTFTIRGTGNFGSNTSWNFNNLAIGIANETSTITSTGSGTATVAGDITVNQTLNGTKSFIVNGGDFSGNGITNLTGGTVTVDGTGTFAGFPAWTVNNLTIGDGSGAATTTLNFFNTLTVSGDLTIAANQTLENNTNDKTLDVNGNVTINGILSAASDTSRIFSVGGNWTNNGTFTHNNGLVTLDGSVKQTLTGTMTGASSFYNLTLTNTSGTADPGCGTSFTPGIDFASAATVSNNYTITTGSVKVEYNSGATYTIANINWNGQGAGTPIQFRNSNLSSGTWLVNVSGTQTAVSYVDVARSDASSGSQIDADDGTNTDCNNNTNWLFPGGTSTFEQADYRFGVINPNSVTIDYTGAPAENTGLTLDSIGQKFRLRVVLHIGTANVSTSSETFKLRIAEKTAASCTVGLTYSDVSDSSGGIRFYNNSTPADGDNIATVTGDPDHSGHIRNYQDYEESNNFTNSVSAINAGEDGVWDFSLENNSAFGGKRYCFKVTKSDNSDLDTYTNFPEIYVDEILSFTLDSTSKNFGTITPGSSPSDQTNTLTTSTNATSGYQATLWATQLLTKGAATIANWTGSNTSPTTFSGAGNSAFGYSTSDSNLGGGTANRFTSAANLFAGFALSGPGDIVADNTSAPVSNDQHTVTYRLRSGASQEAGTYTATLIYIITATY